MESSYNILILQTGFIGDVILSTPVFDAVLDFYPNARLTLLTTPAAFPLFEQDPRFVKVLSFDKRKSQAGLSGLLNMAKILRDLEFDIVFSLHKSYRTAALLALSRIPKRYGFTEAKCRFLYTVTSFRSPYSHDVLRNLSIFNALGSSPQELKREMFLHIPLSVVSEVEKMFRGLPFAKTIVVAPGSVWKTKRWRADGFAAVVKHFLNQKVNVILIGAPEEESLCTEIASSSASGEGLLNIAGTASLLFAAGCIERADVLLCNDSSPMHIASATQTPVVSTFCATVPAFGYTPWMVPHRIVEVQDLACRPCGRHGGNICPIGSFACSNLISDSAVIQAVESLLVNSTGKH